MKQPLALEIKGNALDDGPGIRSVVFFKGCPLSCTWCHNPESKRTGVEIGFDAKTCVGCDTCMGACLENALSRDNPFFINRSACTLCFKCADACPSGALSRIWVPELRQAHAFKYLMENRKPIIRKNDLIAGTTTTKEIGVVVYPDSMAT